MRRWRAAVHAGDSIRRRRGQWARHPRAQIAPARDDTRPGSCTQIRLRARARIPARACNEGRARLPGALDFFRDRRQHARSLVGWRRQDRWIFSAGTSGTLLDRRRRERSIFSATGGACPLAGWMATTGPLDVFHERGGRPGPRWTAAAGSAGFFPRPRAQDRWMFSMKAGTSGTSLDRRRWERSIFSATGGRMPARWLDGDDRTAGCFPGFGVDGIGGNELLSRRRPYSSRTRREVKSRPAMRSRKK